MNQTTSSSSAAGSASRFRGEILREVYRVWLFRRLAPVLVAEVVITALVLYGLGRLVFIQRVAENALAVFFRDPAAIFQFALSAFIDAPVATKVLSLGLLTLAALVIRGITQGALRFILVKQNFFGRAGKND